MTTTEAAAIAVSVTAGLVSIAALVINRRQRTHLATVELSRRVRAAVFIADDEDDTEWQRGYRACANRALYELDAQPPEWTPPPPGDTREQLPDRILDLIRPYMKHYTSSACETAFAITRRLRLPALTDEEAKELTHWQERLWARCRTNQKYTGQVCAGTHHDHSHSNS